MHSACCIHQPNQGANHWQILAFLNAYVMLQEHNELVVFAVTSTGWCDQLHHAVPQKAPHLLHFTAATSCTTL
jgi:hypothetical protein